jgi:hypothetical protein
MPIRNTPREPAAKRTTKKPQGSVPVTAEPVSTAAEQGSSYRNAVIQGNEAVDLDDVRRRAYEIYEREGRPEGRHEEHWRRAEEEVRSSRIGARKRSA